MKTKLFLTLAIVCVFLGMKAQSWSTVGYSNFSAGITNFTCIAVDLLGTPYVAYEDGANGLKITVMKYNGTAWVNVGTPGFSSGQARDISIAIDGSGIPYVSFYDTSPGKATVMKFNGTSWVMVGLYASITTVKYTSLKIDASGAPVLAFQDGFVSDKVTVKKFDGTNWNIVGVSGFSAGEADYISLQLDNTGTPYVAYEDYGNSNMATVMKFDGTNWVDVGIAGFSATSVKYTSLALNASGMPFVAFQDDGSSSKISVMKFDGTNWVTMGASGFSVNTANYISLLIANNGIAYVTYTDSFFSNRPFVQYFNGTSWIGMSTGLTTGAADFTSLAVNANTLFLAYQEGSSSFKANVMKYDLPLGILENSSKENSVVYPNPFSASTCIEFSSSVKNATLIIYNAVGQKVKTISEISGDRILFYRDKLSEGAYTYVIESDIEIFTYGKLMIVN